MANPISLAQAQEHLLVWLNADKALASGQEYEIDTGGSRRKLTRVDADEIRKNIQYWSGQVAQLTDGR